jgi:hypothetical protein
MIPPKTPWRFPQQMEGDRRGNVVSAAGGELARSQERVAVALDGKKISGASAGRPSKLHELRCDHLQIAAAPPQR